MMLFRMGACLATVVFFNLNRGLPYDSEINPKECFRDYTFIWTKKYNDFLVQNVNIREWYMIYAGVLMDCMQLYAVRMWYNDITTFRTIINFGVFNATR